MTMTNVIFDIRQQFVRAGLIDEISIHLVPILLGGGTRMFGELHDGQRPLEVVDAVAAPSATHLTYRVVR